MNTAQLKTHAKNIRMNIVKMVANAASGHPGGSLSAADIMTVLYFEEMDINVRKKSKLYDWMLYGKDVHK